MTPHGPLNLLAKTYTKVFTKPKFGLVLYNLAWYSAHHMLKLASYCCKTTIYVRIFVSSWPSHNSCGKKA